MTPDTAAEVTYDEYVNPRYPNIRAIDLPCAECRKTPGEFCFDPAVVVTDKWTGRKRKRRLHPCRVRLAMFLGAHYMEQCKRAALERRGAER